MVLLVRVLLLPQQCSGHVSPRRPVTITRYNSWWSSGSRCSVLIVLISYVAPGTAAAAAVFGACVTSNRPTTGAERYDEERAYAARHGDAAQHYETFLRRKDRNYATRPAARVVRARVSRRRRRSLFALVYERFSREERGALLYACIGIRCAAYRGGLCLSHPLRRREGRQTPPLPTSVSLMEDDITKRDLCAI